MALKAKLYGTERSVERHDVTYASTLRQAERPIDIDIQNISAAGFRAVSPVSLAPNDEVTVGLAGVGQVKALVVWAHAPIYGLQFMTALTQRDLASIAPHENVAPLPATGQQKAPDFDAHKYGFVKGSNSLVSAVNIVKSIGLATGYSVAAIAAGFGSTHKQNLRKH